MLRSVFGAATSWSWNGRRRSAPVGSPLCTCTTQTTRYVLEGQLGFRLGEREVVADAGSAVLAARGTPHTYWNAGLEEARYLPVMTPKIARLIEAFHEPGTDIPAAFIAHDSELLGWG
jgi:hypothetical protein